MSLNIDFDKYGHNFTDFNLSDIDPNLKADLFYKGNEYTIVMYDSKRLITKSWKRVGYEPILGVDVADFDQADEVIEEMILEWKNEPKA